MARLDTLSPTPDRLHNIPTTQALLGGLGRTTVFELMRTRQLASVKVGRRRMVPQSAIDDYIRRLGGEQGPQSAA